MDIKNVPNLPLYVDCAYMNGNWKYYSMDVHSHGLFECNYIAEGSCVYEIAGKEYPLTKRNLILLDSSIPHRIHFNHERPCTVLGFSLSFDAVPGQAAFPPFLQLLNSSLDICLLFSSLEDVRIFPDARSLKPDMLRLYHEYEGRRDNLYLNSLSYHFLAELSRLPMTEKSSAQYYVEKATDYIREAFYLIKSNEQIADHIGLNATYLERIFKRATGTSLWESVTSCRLKAAEELLANPSIPIQDIDTMIGFANRQTFYLQFKKKYGMSPSAYRKSLVLKK